MALEHPNLNCSHHSFGRHSSCFRYMHGLITKWRPAVTSCHFTIFYFGLGSKLFSIALWNTVTAENWDDWTPMSLVIPAGSKGEAGEPRSYRNRLNSHFKHFPHEGKLCSRDLWTISKTLLSCKCIQYTTADLEARLKNCRFTMQDCMFSRGSWSV